MQIECNIFLLIGSFDVSGVARDRAIKQLRNNSKVIAQEFFF
jgi:hypothetical protein